MNGVIAVILGFIVTAITSIIPNPFLPMLFSSFPFSDMGIGVVGQDTKVQDYMR